MTSLFDISNDTYITVPPPTHTVLPSVANPANPAYASYGYDGGANFNNTSHEYIVPSDGLYRVSFKLVLKSQIPPGTFTSGSYFTRRFRRSHPAKRLTLSIISSGLGVLNTRQATHFPPC